MRISDWSSDVCSSDLSCRSTRATSSALRQVRPRVDRLAVVADLDVQHVAGGTAAAHPGDLFAGLHHLALVDQPGAVVAVDPAPFGIVSDGHNFAEADQAPHQRHTNYQALRSATSTQPQVEN